MRSLPTRHETLRGSRTGFGSLDVTTDPEGEELRKKKGRNGNIYCLDVESDSKTNGPSRGRRKIGSVYKEDISRISK